MSGETRICKISKGPAAFREVLQVRFMRDTQKGGGWIDLPRYRRIATEVGWDRAVHPARIPKRTLDCRKVSFRVCTGIPIPGELSGSSFFHELMIMNSCRACAISHVFVIEVS